MTQLRGILEEEVVQFFNATRQRHLMDARTFSKVVAGYLVSGFCSCVLFCVSFAFVAFSPAELVFVCVLACLFVSLFFGGGGLLSVFSCASNICEN